MSTPLSSQPNNQLDSLIRQQQQRELKQSSDEDQIESDNQNTHPPIRTIGTAQSKRDNRRAVSYSDDEDEDDDDNDLDGHVSGAMLLGGDNQHAADTNKDDKQGPPPKSPFSVSKAQQSLKWVKSEQQMQMEVLAKLEGNGFKEKKIRQLAQKIKSLNLLYERQKTMRRMENQKRESASKSKKQIVNASSNSTINTNLNATITSIGSIGAPPTHRCPHCSEADKKLMEMRHKMQTMKSQLNKIERVLIRELGENFNIDEALSTENGWKGRQQKIEKLKSRVMELQQKLRDNGIQNLSHMSGFTINPGSSTTIASSVTQQSRVSSVQADNKRKELENLKIKVDALQSQNEILQGKMKAMASRKTTVEAELKEVRQQVQKKKQLLLEKSQNDDQLIELLKAENVKLKRDERVITKVIYKDGKEVEDEIDKLKAHISDQQKRIKFLESKAEKALDKAFANL